ncbi:MAG TPA: peptidoglycan DD-metalloendopeptidase family protein [Ilumatobacteraceae bacterium]|nr:peptidoglycan DD-metalloendopeptidase family protein [Ilumatobacteraceae bacterium]
MTPPEALSPIGVDVPVPPGGRRRRRLRAAAATTVAVAVISVGVTAASIVTEPSVAAQTSEEAARRAAREIQAARDRANAAAAAFLQAQSDLELLQDEAGALEAEAAVLVDRVEQLRLDVQSLAVARFAASGSQGIPLLTGLQAPKDQVQADVLVDVVTNAGASSLDEFEFAQKELRDKQNELDDRRRDVEAQQVLFTELQAQAEAEVLRLREIEEQRLTDEAVRRALAAQQAAALAKLEEAELRNAEAAARALPNPGVLAAQAAAAEAAASAAAGDGDATANGPQAPAPGVPVVTVAPNTGASGGTSGGRTGTGGAGSTPIGVLNGDVYIDAIVCPMPGSAYGDTWGAPRSGGRRHEGVDMLAPTGTPIFAVVSGTVRFSQNRLGGNAVSLVGDNGNRYYYAHLSRYEGSSRRVSQGELIGYNGDTGNATGVPHLHFEVHPGGGLAVNPTPSVRAAGC